MSVSSENLKLSEKIRLRVFYGIHNVLLYKNVTTLVGVILTIVHYIQMIVLTYNNNQASLNSTYTKEINLMLEAVLVFPTLRRNPSNGLYLFLFLASVALISFYFLSMVVFLRTEDLKKNSSLQSFAFFVSFMFELSRKIFFMPVLGVLLLSYDCDIVKFDQCFGAQHIVVVIFATLLGIFYMLFEYVIEAFYFSFSFKTRDCFARAPSTISIASLIYEVMSVILLAYFFKDEYSVLFGVFQTFFAYVFLNNYITKLPYFNDVILKVQSLGAASLLWVNASLLLIHVSKMKMLEVNIMSVIVVGIIFFVTLISNYRAIFIKNVLTKDPEDIKSDIHLDAKSRLLYKLAKDSFKESSAELFLASLLRIHANKCVRESCPCKYRSELYDPKKLKYGEQKKLIHKDLIFIKHYILNMIRLGVIKFLDSKLMMLDLIYFLFETLTNYPQAFVQLHAFKRRNVQNRSSIIDFIIFRIEYSMQEHLQSRNMEKGSTRLKIENVLIYDQKINQLKDQMAQVTNNFIDIWEIIDSQVPDLQIMSKAFQKNLTEIEDTQKLYEQILQINNHSITLKLLMEIYSQKIIHNELLMAKIQDDIKPQEDMNIVRSENIELENIHESWDMFDDKSCIIEMSSNYDKLGRIVDFSKNAPKLFGYSPADLRIQNINAIIPRLMTKLHTQTLKSYFEVGFQKIIGKSRRVFAIHKDGHCFSIMLIIKILPSLGNFRIIGMIHKLNDEDYILTDAKGDIDSVGLNVAKALGISASSISNMKINLQTIAPKTVTIFEDYFKHSDLSKTAANFDEPQQRNFLIYLPQSMDKFAQRFNEDIQVIDWDCVDRYHRHRTNGTKFSRELEINALENKAQYAQKLYSYLGQYKYKKVENCLRVSTKLRHVLLFRGQLVTYAFKLTKKVKREGVSFLTREKRDKQEKFIPRIDEHKNKIKDKIKKIKEHLIELDVLEDRQSKQAVQEKAENNEVDQRTAIRMTKLLPYFKKKSGSTNNIKSKNSLDDEETLSFLRNQTKGDNFATVVQGLMEKNRQDKGIVTESALPFLKPRETGDAQPTQEPLPFPGYKKNILKNAIGKKGSKGESKLSLPLGGTQQPRLKSILKKKSEEFERMMRPVSKLSEDMKSRLKKQVARIRYKLNDSEVDSRAGSPVMERKDSSKSIDSRRRVELGLDYQGDTDSDASLLGNEHDTQKTEISQSREAKMAHKRHLRDEFNFQVDQFGGGQDQQQLADLQSQSSFASVMNNKKIAKYLRESLVNQKTPKTLQSSYYLLYALLFLLIFLSLGLELALGSQNRESFRLLDTSVKPDSYGYLLLICMDGYMSFKLLAQNILSSTVYNSATWEPSARDIHQSYINTLRTKLFEENKRAEAEETFIHQLADYNMRFPEPQKLPFSFDKFTKLVINAIEETKTLPISSMNDNDNEYLYILNHNQDPLIAFIDKESRRLKDQTIKEFSTLNNMVFGMWITNLVVMLIAFAFSLPIILKTRLTIQNILALFTKISKDDSEHFLWHYKDVRIKWNQLSKDEVVLHKEIMSKYRAASEKEKDKGKQSFVNRSKTFKGLRSQNYAFFVVSLIFLAITITVLSIRAWTHMNEIKMMKSHGTFLQTFASFNYEFTKVYLKFKSLLATSATDFASYNQALFDNYKAIQTNFHNIPSLSEEALNPEKVSLSTATSLDVQKFFFENACQGFVATADNAKCIALLKSLLLRGYQAFLHDSSSYIEIRFNVIDTSRTTSTQSSQVTYNTMILNEESIRDMRDGLIYTQQGFEKLMASIRKDLGDLDTSQQKLNIAFIAVYFALLLMFLLIFWRKQYEKLRYEVFRTNHYFTLVAFRILRENQHIRLYLQKSLNVKSLNAHL